MTPRGKSALLWGAIGALTFLVLAQGAVLLSVPLPVGFLGLLGVAAALGGLVAVVAHRVEHRLTGKGQA
ncbi:hypothetical protein [Halorarum salinum]|uniref:DUF7981 domain-containing protein n=1 Tax=Halorarum salinum TaxID=2743089 RepID=A0A7D5LD61_9EURY|nr:hypothetical protein [Halobaculum salinum]QLG63768.1 hypothetical protein HUG12_19380 [Halobaculum salinum]